MYRSKRKAFTITELVIVIAVIAILAAVLIPTFSNVVESANKSAAMSNCRMAVAEYISMVTLDDDPDNNDVSGMVFSNDGYYFVYMDQKLAELGQAGKSNNILNIASDSTTVDAGALEGFDIQTSRSADAIQTVTFTVNGKSTTVDLNELKNTGRALYLYNFQSEDGSKYAGFFVINAADGGDDYVISGANYSLVAGYSKYSESGPIKIATDTPTVEQPLLTEVTAQYTGIPVKAGEEVTSVNVTVTATYSDGSSKEVENFTASDIPSTAGKHNVTFGYTDGEVTLTCQAEVYVASGLTATLRNEGQPLVLKHNGTVDIGDVDAVYDIAYDLGDTTQPAQSAEVTAVVSDTVGQTGSVTLTCGAFQLTIDNLTVEKVFDSIKAVYEGGEIEINGKLDAGKVLVYAIFSDRTTEPITEGYTLSSVDTSAAGEKTVTVTYGEDNPKTATFTVTVVEVTANTYYFYNFAGWESVSAYAWSGTGETEVKHLGEWPGTAMTAVEGKWYSITVDATAENIIFNGSKNGTVYQTNTLSLGDTSKPYYAITGWSAQQDVSNIVVLDLTQNTGWTSDGARFAVNLYTMNGEEKQECWLDFTAVGGQNIDDVLQYRYFAVDISNVKDYNGEEFVPATMIVCRMNGSSTENNWDNKWNQTNNLELMSGLYVTIPGDSWNWGMQSEV